jgi:ectoine hydroxylase-related dioxygenase (phytanoyl-CoA dioxygenase family)
MTMTMTQTRNTQCFVYPQLGEQQKKAYQEQGYLALGRTLTDQGLEQMRRQCMDAWGRHKQAFDPDKDWLQNALLTNIHHHCDLVRQFYFAGPLVDAAEAMIGPNIKCATSQLTFKMRGNTMPFDWHQDNGYGELDPYSAMSCLTGLDDSDEENGCLWLIPASHREGQVEVKRSSDPANKYDPIKLELDETKAIAMPLKAGESLIIHCHMLHKSQGNFSKDRDRRIVFVRYADADAVEVYNDGKPRLGRLVRGQTKFDEVRQFEADL